VDLKEARKEIKLLKREVERLRARIDLFRLKEIKLLSDIIDLKEQKQRGTNED
jgi:hypothetical protein